MLAGVLRPAPGSKEGSGGRWILHRTFQNSFDWSSPSWSQINVVQGPLAIVTIVLIFLQKSQFGEWLQHPWLWNCFGFVKRQLLKLNRVFVSTIEDPWIKLDNSEDHSRNYDEERQACGLLAYPMVINLSFNLHVFHCCFCLLLNGVILFLSQRVKDHQNRMSFGPSLTIRTKNFSL